MKKFYGLDIDQATTDVIKWGDQFEYRNGAGAVPPSQESKFLLIEIPPLDGMPHLFTLDLEIVNPVTNHPPGWPGVINYWGGAFIVRFGAGNDARDHIFPPGIHSIIADALRVSIQPHVHPPAALTFHYRAHCMIQDGVPPSYSYI